MNINCHGITTINGSINHVVPLGGVKNIRRGKQSDKHRDDSRLELLLSLSLIHIVVCSGPFQESDDEEPSSTENKGCGIIRGEMQPLVNHGIGARAFPKRCIFFLKIIHNRIARRGRLINYSSRGQI